MRAWIAGSMAVLGTLLVLAGGAIIVLKSLQPAAADAVPAEEPAKVPERLANAVRRMPAADRLIGWGIVLLVLGAIAAGAIGFRLDADAGTR